jgi:AraC-like DNA-binding protein
MHDRAIRHDRHAAPTGRWEYAIAQPALALQGHVRGYTGYHEFTPGVMRRREVPTGNVALILSFGPSISVHDPRRPGRPESRTSFVVGLDDSYAVTESTGDQHGVQVNLTPPAAHMLLGVPMDDLARRVVALDDVLGAEAARLGERLHDAPGWEARFALLDSALGSRLSEARPPLPGIVWAWRRLEVTGGRVEIGDLARELGWSRKRLIVRFREQVGLSPKLLARILRFERVVRLIRAGGRRSWVETAYDCGYYDQAHLNRDFREFAGTTPTAFLASRMPGGAGIEG